jgi:hypothetical protein
MKKPIADEMLALGIDNVRRMMQMQTEAAS